MLIRLNTKKIMARHTKFLEANDEGKTSKINHREKDTFHS